MSKRGERLTRPLRPDEWELVAITGEAARGWEQLAAAEPAALARAYDQLSSEPGRHSERQHRMKGPLGTGLYEGRAFPRWQLEVTSAGRIWYFIDDPGARAERHGRGPRPRRRVLIEMVTVGHPKITDR